MSWRIIHVSTVCKLNCKNSQFVYQPENDEPTSIPLEDISVIILENHQVTLTNYLLAQLAEHNIVLFTCNEKHSPSGIFYPFFQHSRNTEIAFLQSEWSESFKKRLWQQIIRQKIANQSKVLKMTTGSDKLYYLIDKVQSGDTTNVESFASRMYWANLFDNFKRHSSCKRNASLDYGYAIIRAVLARFIAASGLIPCFGVHHSNKLNAFNLADDLIEPFRPFVDFAVYHLPVNESETLDKIDKIHLLSVLNKQCCYKNESLTLLKACEFVCFSIVKATKSKQLGDFALPSFIEDGT
jgi:CRISPR-associated protein Cas1